jgi:hypothetical protein
VLILPPRSSWLYRLSVSLSPTRRYLVTFLFVTMCTALWFHYIYQPLNTRIDVAQKQAKIPKRPSSEDLLETINALRNDLAVKRVSLSHDDQLHAVLGYIEHVGMVLEHCSMQDKALYVQGLGTYKQCLAFFDQLASSAYPLVPRDVRITRSADNLFCLSVAIEPL